MSLVPRQLQSLHWPANRLALGSSPWEAQLLLEEEILLFLKRLGLEDELYQQHIMMLLENVSPYIF